jgi:hypothetical protein
MSIVEYIEILSINNIFVLYSNFLVYIDKTDELYRKVVELCDPCSNKVTFRFL